MTARSADSALGDLPGWNLDDLYPGPAIRRIHSPIFPKPAAEAARLRDPLERQVCRSRGARNRQMTAWARRLKPMSARRIDGQDHFLRRPDLLHRQHRSRQGEVLRRCAKRHYRYQRTLLFFALELNRIDDTVIDACIENDESRAAKYAPWIRDLRLDKPYQLEDRVEQLFHEKSMTGRAAWNRLVR
jgi:oligoendopeptidase F